MAINAAHINIINWLGPITIQGKIGSSEATIHSTLGLVTIDPSAPQETYF